jgi:NAD(P)-dependent dehydrogenase (short-subunit alcohol dehydrogenase family)
METFEEHDQENLLHNQVAIVTGGANGIGQSIAIALARAGAHVVIADTDETNGMAVAERLRQMHKTALMVRTDVSQEQDHLQLIERTEASLGPAHILVNNVGVGVHQGGLLHVTRENAERILTTNVLGPLLLTKRVAQEMISHHIKGIVLFISSIHAQVIYPDPVYGCTKAAIESLVRNLAFELAAYGIRVNAVSPGAIATGHHAPTHQLVPLEQRRGTRQEVANAVVFLASNQASYITGQTLIVDGGLALVHPEY